MYDRKFIIFLCKQIQNTVVDGDDPDLDAIIREFRNKRIETENIFDIYE